MVALGNWQTEAVSAVRTVPSTGSRLATSEALSLGWMKESVRNYEGVMLSPVHVNPRIYVTVSRASFFVSLTLS